MKGQKKVFFRESMKKRGMQVGSLLLAMTLLANVAVTSDAVDVKPRRIDISSEIDSDVYTRIFEESNVTYDEQNEVVNFRASSTYSENDRMLFDNVSLEEVTITNDDMEELYDEDFIDEEQLEELLEEEQYDEDALEEIELEDLEVDYECSFDMNNLVFHFSAELLTENGTVLETEEIETQAIVTEYGGLDACIEVDGETIWLSDYEENASIDECSITDVISIANTYLVVAKAAEQQKIKSNYKYNKKLESDGNGVGKNYFIYDQSDTITPNRKAGNYRFGFTTFANVGCEVASAYNVARGLYDPERLSQTIYYFEIYAIKFSIGWGYLGSNPLEIYRYLEKRGFSYQKYTSYSKFSAAVAKKKNCKIIMSRWNVKKTNGLHTFYVAKTGQKSFYGYNWHYDTKWRKNSSLDAFNDGSGFIVGYIVWK